MQDTSPLLFPTDFPALARESLQILQVNLGYKCNLSCTHCHVNAGPTRTEMMTADVAEAVMNYLEYSGATVLDLTGGAPELSPEFRSMVRGARAQGVEVIDRCNLTILEEPGQEDLSEFLADQQVTIVASLPCYSEKNVREQRGNGVFESSIRGLQQLNALGYGSNDNLQLNLVYNPNGAFLPPAQEALEQDYKRILMDEFGIVFNSLYAIANMPIKRFGATLLAKGGYQGYMNLLKDNFHQDNLGTVMCKNTLSVDWQGFIYDCDFNQMLDMPINLGFNESELGAKGNLEENSKTLLIQTDRTRAHISDLLNIARSHAGTTPSNALEGHKVLVGEHCYGCTAGQGSSCGGAL